MEPYPPYWKLANSASADSEHGVQVVELEQDAIDFFQNLLSACSHNRESKPELCPHLYLSASEVIGVKRVENPDLWTSFKLQQRRMAARSGAVPPSSMNKLTEEIEERFECKGACQQAGEKFLCHGPPSETAAMSIAQEGFNLNCANPKSLFGSGLYHTDHPCKAIFYANKQAAESNQTVSSLIVSRVYLGVPFHSNGQPRYGARRPPRKCECQQETCQCNEYYDSVMAEVGVNGQGVHSEAVVYHEAQAYPEFIITLKPIALKGPSAGPGAKPPKAESRVGKPLGILLPEILQQLGAGEAATVAAACERLSRANLVRANDEDVLKAEGALLDAVKTHLGHAGVQVRAFRGLRMLLPKARVVRGHGGGVEVEEEVIGVVAAALAKHGGCPVVQAHGYVVLAMLVSHPDKRGAARVAAPRGAMAPVLAAMDQQLNAPRPNLQQIFLGMKLLGEVLIGTADADAEAAAHLQLDSQLAVALKVMFELRESAAALQHCYALLVGLAPLRQHLRTRYGLLSTVDAVLEGMHDHPSVTGLQAAAVRALVHVLGGTGALQEGGVHLILTALARDGIPKEDFQSGSKLILQATDAKPELASTWAVWGVMDALRKGVADTKLQLAGLGLLRTLAADSEAWRKTIGAAGGAEKAVAAMRAHAGSEPVQTQGCAVLRAVLASQTKLSLEVCVLAGGVKAILEAVRRFAGGPTELARDGYAALAELAGAASGQQEMEAAGVREEVLQRLDLHPPEVQVWSNRLLQRLPPPDAPPAPSPDPPVHKP